MLPPPAGIDCGRLLPSPLLQRSASVTGVVASSHNTYQQHDTTRGDAISFPTASSLASESNYYSNGNSLGRLGSRAKQETDDEVFNPSLVMARRSKRTDKSKSNSGNESSFIIRIFRSIINMIIKVITLFIICAVATLLFGLCITWMRDRCTSLRNSQIDLVTVEDVLRRHVVGQELAMQQLLAVLRDFHAKPWAEPRVAWCVGWTGTGKSRTLDLLKRVLGNTTNVQYFLPTFLPTSSEALDAYAVEAVTQMNPCLKDVILVDGWDDGNDLTVIRFIESVIERVKESDVEDSNQLLVIVTGVAGSRSINREYLSHRQAGTPREDIALHSYLNIIGRTDEFHILKTLGPLIIVPFLPLEAAHVEKCVKKEFLHVKKMLDNDLIVLRDRNRLEELTKEELARGVLAQLTFLPPEAPLLSSTGCKGVTAAIRLLLGDTLLA